MSKHLLECLDQYTRAQTHDAASARAHHYNALDLKALVQEIRDSSDEKSGLQEFYETLERIVNELRGMTEHSTAFLNRVRKSDAPNYFDIIKNPMDLGLLLKKVKMRDYRDKKSFTDDLNLIWDNCFEYNTWVDHPLRRSATILRNKGNQLLQFVNDVPQKPSMPALAGISRPGSFRAQSTVAASEADAEGDADTDLDDGEMGTPASAARMGQKRRMLGRQSRAGTEQTPDTPDRGGTPASAADEDAKMRDVSMVQEGTPAPVSAQQRESSLAQAAAQSLTASTRRQLEDQNVTPFEDWPALERTTQTMSEFMRLQSAFHAGQPVALPFASSSSVTLESAPSDNGKRERTMTPAKRSSTQELPELVTLDDEGFLKQMRRRELFRSAVPDIPYRSTSVSTTEEVQEDGMLLSVEPAEDSLGARIHANLQLIQDVRKLNVSVLQAHPRFHASNGLLAADSSDEEGASGSEEETSASTLLATCQQCVHPRLYRTDAAEAAGQRDLISSLSLLLNHNGFNGAHRRAMDALKDLVKEYIFNLGRTAKYFSESHGAHMTLAEVLGQTLAENGIPRPESLSQHINDVDARQGTLERMREKLRGLRDTLQSGKTEGSLPDYLTSPAAFMENEASADAGPPPKEPVPFTAPEPFVSLRDSDSPDSSASSSESITAQIGLLQPYMKQRATTDWGVLDDAELPARMKKGVVRPKVPASGKIPTKRRATAAQGSASNSSKKHRVASG